MKTTGAADITELGRLSGYLRKSPNSGSFAACGSGKTFVGSSRGEGVKTPIEG